MAKLCYRDKNRLIINVKSKELYVDCAVVVKERFCTSYYEVHRLLPIGTNKNVIDLVEDKVGAKITKKLVAPRPQLYNYFKGDSYQDHKQRSKSDAHSVFTENVIKNVLSANDDNRMQTPDGLTTYLYGHGCQVESLEYSKIKIEYNA